ncbi:MAG TPA: hypothetical protein VLK22_03135 [Candidatus Udaeobacter sp.]|nr:hypothetical protein [Candidatus Udaeobacter sp.]
MQKIFITFFSLLLLTVGFVFSDYAVAATSSVQQEALDQLRTAGNAAGVNTSNANSKDIRLMVATVIRFALGFVGIIFFVMALYAGFLWMTAGGEEDKISTAKSLLTNGVIGLAIILSAYALTTYVITVLISATTKNSSAGSI